MVLWSVYRNEKVILQLYLSYKAAARTTILIRHDPNFGISVQQSPDLTWDINGFAVSMGESGPGYIVQGIQGRLAWEKHFRTPML
jgi:hypothetical protein